MTDKKIKITHVARFAKPHIGGIEAVIEQINENLPNEEFEKEIFCCSNTEKTSIENNVKYNRFRYLFNFAANSISPQLFLGMIGLKTDIIHFHMPVIQNVIIWFILYHLRLIKYKKMIISYHGAIVGYDKIMKYFRNLYDYFFKKADLIHVLSPTIIDSDKILYNNREKCNIIPYSINTKTEKPSNDIKINGYDINKTAQGRVKLLCMGRLVGWKGFQIIIKSMATVENAVLFIAGNGPLFKTLSKSIEQNKLQNKIILLGSVSSKEEKQYLFSNIDIFILPTIRSSESFGIVQLEAMNYSKPVINTNLGTGVNYVSVDKETGLTVEPENVEQLSNAINKLINNHALRLEYGKNAKKRVETLFNIEINQQHYKNMYKELLNE